MLALSPTHLACHGMERAHRFFQFSQTKSYYHVVHQHLNCEVLLRIYFQQQKTVTTPLCINFIIVVVVVSVLPLGRFLASMFSILSCFPPFSLIPHTTLLSETHLAYPLVFFP